MYNCQIFLCIMQKNTKKTKVFISFFRTGFETIFHGNRSYPKSISKNMKKDSVEKINKISHIGSPQKSAFLGVKINGSFCFFHNADKRPFLFIIRISQTRFFLDSGGDNSPWA